MHLIFSIIKLKFKKSFYHRGTENTELENKEKTTVNPKFLASLFAIPIPILCLFPSVPLCLCGENSP